MRSPIDITNRQVFFDILEQLKREISDGDIDSNSSFKANQFYKRRKTRKAAPVVAAGATGVKQTSTIVEVVARPKDLDSAERAVILVSPLSVQLTKPTEQAIASGHDTSRQSDKSSRVFQSGTSRKRKSDVLVESTESSGGLFKGLAFFFIPNDAVSKPRRLRIEASIRQGATWARTVSKQVTHIIVEPEIDAAAVMRVVANKVNWKAIEIVKSTWLVESMRYREVRSTSWGRFQVREAIEHFPKVWSKRPAIPNRSSIQRTTRSTTLTSPLEEAWEEHRSHTTKT